MALFYGVEVGDMDDPPDDYFWDWGGRREPPTPEEEARLLAVAEQMGRAAASALDNIALAALERS